MMTELFAAAVVLIAMLILFKLVWKLFAWLNIPRWLTIPTGLLLMTMIILRTAKSSGVVFTVEDVMWMLAAPVVLALCAGLLIGVEMLLFQVLKRGWRYGTPALAFYLLGWWVVELVR